MAFPSQVVIFGASGDLTLRKLIPALASLAQKGKPKDGFSVVGVERGEAPGGAPRHRSAPSGRSVNQRSAAAVRAARTPACAATRAV